MTRNRRSAKKAGSEMESATALYLSKALDDSRIERRVKNGSKDRGDINGVMLDGQRVVIECKNTSRLNIPEHLKEAEIEAGNDDAVFYALVQKRHGVGLKTLESIGEQYVIMTLRQYALMLNHGLPLAFEEE